VIRYITLAEYMWQAEQVTGVDADVLAKAWLRERVSFVGRD
jgi:hypothetical protein